MTHYLRRFIKNTLAISSCYQAVDLVSELVLAFSYYYEYDIDGVLLYV